MNYIFKHFILPIKRSFDLKLYYFTASIVVVSLLSGCGEVISSRDFSTINTAEIGWRNVLNINTTNIMLFPLNGTCTTEAGDVSIQVGNPPMTSQVLPCVAGKFATTMDLSAVGLPEGPIDLIATQSVISADATTSLIVDTVVPLAPVIITPAASSILGTTVQVVDGTCETGTQVNITGDVRNGNVVTTCVGGTFTAPITITNGDGVKSIVVTQTDPAGNTSPSNSVTITLDTAGSLLPSAPVITSPTTGSLTTTTSQTVIGTCEDGATLNISGSVVGSPIALACVGGTYNQPITLVPGDGVKTITITQTNVAGTSPAANVVLTLDTMAPSAPMITAPTTGSNTNTVSQTIVGTCETGATVSITGNVVGAPVNAICVGGTYSEPITVTPGDGPKTITVDQTDPAGNTSPSTNISITLDTLVPLAPTITSPTTGSITNLGSQTIVGTCETGTTVRISGNVVGSPVATACTAGNYSQPVTLTPGDGVKSITVGQRDLAGNNSPTTNISITLDTTAPSAPTVTSPTNGSTSSTTSQTVAGSCETGATVNISGAITGSPIAASCVAGNYSQPVTLTSGDGVKAISVTQTDTASNTSPSTNISITLDATAPSAPTITAPANGSTVSAAAQTVVGACETGATVNISGDILGSPVTATCVASSYSRAVTLTAVDGVKAISATQTDAGANTSVATNISITLDAGAPLAPTITSPTNGSYTNTTAQTIVGACETGATVNISGAIAGSPVTASCVASAYSRAVTLTAGDGAKAISATQTDAGMNTSPATNISITLDTSAPSAPTITAPITGSFTNLTATTVTGACETGATVNLTGALIGSPVTVVCAGSSYSQAVTLTSGDGVKAISATQTDLANNTSVAANISVNLDQTAPAAPTITSPVNGSTANVAAQTITGTCVTGHTVNITGDVVGSPVATSCVAGNYSENITISGGDGLKNISVTQTDLASNTSPSTSITVDLDTGLPAAPTITSPTNGSYTNLTAQTVVGACETGSTVNISGAIVGSPVTATCTASAYSRAVTLTAGNGIKAISATQTDAGMNTSPATNISITLDQTAPSAPTITSPANGSTVGSVSQTVVGACETGATVNISGAITGSPVTATCVASSYSRAVTLTAGDGSKAISATQTDLSNNTSTATNISITLDTAAPSAPTITSPTNGSYTNTTAQTVVGACETGATVNISGAITGSPVTTVCVASTYSQAVTLTAGDGAKAISTTQTDAGGNTSTATNVSITLDTATPSAPTITSPTNGSYTNTNSQTVVGACETGSTINISGAIVGSPVTATCVASSYSQAVTLTAGDGSKAISATQTDLANNTSTATNISITLDTTAPSAPTITSPTDSSTTSTTAQTVVGVCETGATVNITGNVVGSPVAFVCIAGSYNEPISLTAGDGPKTISVAQTDPIGNTSATTTISITLDSGVPAAPTITSPTNGSYTNTTSQTVVGACETGATVNISGAITGSPVTAICVASAYTRAVTLTAGDGSKSISATQTDAGMNTSPATNISITLDTSVPSAPTITSPLNSSYTNTTAQTVVGACETGATVNISGAIVGSPVAATCVASAYSQAVTLTAGDGAKAISATQTDLANNTSPATNISITLDTAAPSAPTITAPTNGSTANSVSQTITGTCVTGHTVNITGDVVGSPVATSCVAGNYSENITISGGDGIKNISVTQTDLASNTSPSTSITVDLDTGLPAAPTITSPTNGSYTNLTAQTVVGACETGSTVNISGAIVGSPVTATCTASAYSRAVTLTAGDGSKAISATQTDAGMNTSPATNITINLDTANPSAPTITSPTNSSTVNTTSQTVVGACETGATVNISGAITGSPVTATCVASAYSRAVTLTAGDGAKAISATQTDLSNNTSAATNISITLDTAAPSAPTITSPTNGSYTNTTAQTVVGACETGATVNISGAIVGSPVTALCAASAYSRAVTLTAGDGAKAISATQTDAGGNTSTATNISITLDTATPSAPTITSPTNGSYTNTTAQTVVGACETGSTINISGAIVGSPVTATCVASAYSRAVTLTAGDGSKAISATQTDLANNTSTATNISITLDTTAPSAPTITSPTNSSTTNTTAQSVVGACETGATVSITGDVVGSPVAFVCIAGSYNEPITLTSGDAVKTISATQVDPVGNASTTTSVSVTLDGGVPLAPTITSPTNGSYTNTTSQTIVGACETGATVNISGAITGSPVTATCVASAYTRAVTLTAGDGSKSISATQTDAGMNTSPATNISITLDTSAPSAPTITSPTNGSYTNTTSQTIVGSCETGSTVNISGAISGSPVTATCVASAYSQAVTLTAGDGAKAISVTQTDLANNTSTSTNVSITLDTAAPSAPTITSPTNGSSTNTTAQTIVGACETGATVNISGAITGSPVTTSCVASAYSQAVTLTAGDGAKAISASQTDLAGNTSTSTNISVMLDATAPSAPTITSPLSGSYTNTTSQTIVGTCETGATVNISGAITGSPVTTSCVASAYSQAVTLTAGDGAKAISVTQTDLSNNTSTATNISINLDTAAPSAPTITSPTNGSYTSTTAQTIVGACETGATVNISGAITGSPVTATCVASAYSRAVTLTAGDGAKAISATQTDLANNTSAATNISITLDTAAPSAPTITSPINGSYTNTTSQTVSGVCETGATLEIWGNLVGSPLFTVCSASAYSLGVTLTAANGPKTINAHQTDPAGNTSTPVSVTITFDTVAPSAPTITSPANGSYTTTTAQTIVGACETGATVNISGAITGSPVTTSCVASAYSQAVTLTAGDGAKAISASQTDLAGNTSTATNISITLDTAAPSAPTITSPTNSSFVNTTAQTVVGACETGATINISGAITGSPVTATCVASAYSQAVTLVAGDGVKAISATQTDLAGNTSAATNISITLDTVAPAAPTITAPTNGLLTNTQNQTVTGACETGTTISVSGDLFGSPVTTTCVASAYSRSITLTSADGVKAINVTQRDAATNLSPATSISVTLDRTVPAMPTITSPTNGALTNQTAQTVIGACENGATVNISGDIVGSPVTASCLAGNYTRAVTLVSGDGSKSISATQTDGAGNTSVAETITLTLDTTAPSAPTITAPTNGSSTNTTAITVVGVCETGATVYISGDIITLIPVTATCVASAYSQAVTLTAGEGAKAISATQTDVAGNTSGATNISVTLDTAAPSAPTITSPTNGTYTSAPAQTVAGACETNAMVNISGNIVGSPVLILCVASAYSQSVTLTAVNGAKAISVNQTDAANNTSGSASVNLTLDTIAPSTPTITSPANNFRTNNETQTITGACETNATVTITSASLVGPPATGVCVASAYSISITVTAANGTKTYSVSQTDLAGNSSGSVNRNIVIDNTAPTAPTVTSHLEAEYVTSSSITISGACENNATVIITGSVTGTPSGVCAASAYSIAITLSGTDGAKTLNVAQTDVAGNASPTTVRNLTLDTVAPSVVISSASGSPTSASPIVFTVTFSEAIQLFDNAVLTVTNGTIFNYTGGPAVYSVEITPTAVGNVSLQVLANEAQDLAGNNNTISNIVTIDYQTSTLEILSPVDGGLLNPSATVAVSGTCVVGAGNVSITGSAKTGGAVSGVCTAGGTFSINVTSVASGGPYTFIATQAALNDTVNNIWIHCAGAAMRSCALAGSGNVADPYMIGDISCLQEMRVGLTCSYALNNNIDASATSTWNHDGTNFRGWEPIPNTSTITTRFTGRLDGRNRIISNLYITPRAANGTGLFSRIYDEGNGSVSEQIFDLTLSSPTVGLFTEQTFGFLAGTSTTVGIRNVNILGANGDLSTSVGKEYLSLLIGIVTSSAISDSEVSGSFYLNGSFDEANTKYGYIGGLAGQLNTSSATNNSSDLIITSSATNLFYLQHVGGGFGDINDSTVSGFRTGFQIDFTHIGVNASGNGIGRVGGFSGLSRTGTSLNNICVNHDMTLKTTNKTMRDIAGFAGSISTGGAVTHVQESISVAGILNVDANGLGIGAVNGYVGGDLGPSTHTNVVMKSNINLINVVSMNPWDAYGGLTHDIRSGNVYTNVVAMSDHNIAPGINYQSGFASLIDGNVNSGHYANDAFLGGLPSHIAGAGIIDITSASLSTLGSNPNASYTGFDFVTIWERDPLSYGGINNLPKLRYCP